MNIFKRLFKIGQAEAHSAIDNFENPIKMTEQGIRDLKLELDKSLQALAEVKAMAIRSKNDLESETEKAKDYENKAVIILQKAQKNELTIEEADRLAKEALTRKSQCEAQISRSKKEQELFDKNVLQLEGNVKTLRNNLSKWENELRTLKARVKVSSATKNINKQLAQLDGSSTVEMLEKMKDKIAEDEALAQSYGEIANEARSIDEELEKVTADITESKISEDLASLKAKIGLN